MNPFHSRFASPALPGGPPRFTLNAAFPFISLARLHVLVAGMFQISFLYLAVVSTTSAVFGASAESVRFRQDRFVVGSWVPPQSAERLEEHYREMAEAHFNLVIGTAATSVENQIAICSRLGLKVVVDTQGKWENLPWDDACWGYHLVDEPSANQFKELGERVSSLRKLRPGKLAYINLFPNYASMSQLGSSSYEEHVERFMRDVNPDVLSMDHYPMMKPGRDGRDAYLENLAVLRRHALRAKIPFWNYFNSMPFGPHLDPTEAQLRWQIFASIAYGAQGVMYFCYWTPGKGAAGAGEFPKGGAIITAEGHRTRHYQEAKRINSELVSWGPTLMQLTSESVRRIRISGESPFESASGGIRRMEVVKGDPGQEFLVGEFKHRDGRTGLVVLNHDHGYTAWPTLTFGAGAGDVVEVSKETGGEEMLRDDSPELKGLQLSLGAGDARLFLFRSTP